MDFFFVYIFMVFGGVGGWGWEPFLSSSAGAEMPHDQNYWSDKNL